VSYCVSRQRDDEGRHHDYEARRGHAGLDVIQPPQSLAMSMVSPAVASSPASGTTYALVIAGRYHQRDDVADPLLRGNQGQIKSTQVVARDSCC
jgi:hypothetical protein